MRTRWSQGFIALLLLALACDRAEPLTEAKAREVLERFTVQKVPVYAEVPQRVWWSAKAPKDDFDEKSLRTFDNLVQAGLITTKPFTTPDGKTGVAAEVTQKGFPILGTAPSARGACFRATICFKFTDGMRNFQRHPTDPTIGHAELIWHYDEPTSLYPLMETKINKPLKKEFASLVAFYYKDHAWHFDVTVPKTEASGSSSEVPAPTR
jgi:hypothetical protein